MSTAASPNLISESRWFEPDRIGVIASVLCAIHCAMTPFLLLLLPTFGKAWSHPASHWGMALVVIPIAAFTIARGFRQHGRRWVIATGVLGISLILVGAAVPYLKESPTPSNTNTFEPSSDVAAASVVGSQSTNAAGEETEFFTAHANEEPCASECESEEQCASECESEEQCASECESAQSADTTSSEQCEDLCCPTLQASADGGWTLNIPLASILTTLGGLCLIATHVGNLCGCAACRKATQVA